MDSLQVFTTAKLLVFLLSSNFISIESKSFSRLNDMIRHYEPVHYDRDAFHANHMRVRRSTTESNALPITAYGRRMNLQMWRDYDAIQHDVVITTSDGPVEFDHERAYKGYVEGVDDSYVHGLITHEKTFEGRIRIDGDVYNIERATKYFDEDEVDFHSIIYRHTDIEHHKIKGTTCGSHNLHEKQKTMFSKDKAERDEPRVEVFTQTHDGLHSNQPHASTNDDTLTYRPRHNASESTRRKRAIDYDKQQCTLYMEADVTYYEYWGSNPLTVIDEFIVHVQGVNEIYELVDYDLDVAGVPDGITFIIKRIHIWTSRSDTDYKYGTSSWSVDSFLSEFSREVVWDEYCLAYIFNNRDFDGGILGLAWTGDLDSDGGVCEDSARYSSTTMSLNAGLVTIKNYGNIMPRSTTIVTFAHELGHNMGSPHDEDGTDCAPGGTQGNYIMYAHAVDGGKPNNNKFSSCSIASMHTIMARDARSEDTGCFQAVVTSICGNRVVEDGEICDCGYADQCDDTCCDSSTCQLVAGADCSPSSDYCCEADCGLTPASNNRVCRNAADCKDQAFCNGTYAGCPPSDDAANGTYCNDYQQVCVSGECSGSLCLRANMEQCQCAPVEDGDWDDERLCQLCCSPSGGDGANCTSSFDLEPVLNGTTVMSGTPCNDYQGYCDSLLKCKKYDPDSSFRSLRKLFTSLGVKNMQKWLASNWYIPVSATVGFIIMLVLLIKFGVPKKKSDKKKKKKKDDKKDKEKKDNKVGPMQRKRGPPKAREAFSPYSKY